MPRNDGNATKVKNQKDSVGKYPKRDAKIDNKKKKGYRPPTVKPTSGKTKPFIGKQPEGKYGPAYEYKMSRGAANEILKECPSSIKPEQYLCNFVTEQYGLMGWCQRVIIEG